MSRIGAGLEPDGAERRRRLGLLGRPRPGRPPRPPPRAGRGAQGGHRLRLGRRRRRRVHRGGGDAQHRPTGRCRAPRPLRGRPGTPGRPGRRGRRRHGQRRPSRIATGPPRRPVGGRGAAVHRRRGHGRRRRPAPTGDGVRGRDGRGGRPARRRPRAEPGRAHARGAAVVPPRDAGDPGAGRVGGGGPRPGAGQAHRVSLPRATRLHRRVAGHGRGGQGGGAAGDRRGDPPPSRFRRLGGGRRWTRSTR